MAVAISMTADHASSSRPPVPAPAVIRVTEEEVPESAAIRTLVADTRRQADAFLFLSGGASGMPDAARARLLDVFGALAILDGAGVRFAVGDGGTRAGIMEAAGLARVGSGGTFPLIGVAPAPEILSPDGQTPVDPNHTCVVAVDSPAWVARRRATGWAPDQGYWGSETVAMFRLFAALSEGRPSVALVANGGAIVLDEVEQNIAARRRMVVVAGSGRAADALVSRLISTVPADDEIRTLKTRAEERGIPLAEDLIHVFDLNDGPAALARTLRQMLI